jgi:hypothetical protein
MNCLPAQVLRSAKAYLYPPTPPHTHTHTTPCTHRLSAIFPFTSSPFLIFFGIEKRHRSHRDGGLRSGRLPARPSISGAMLKRAGHLARHLFRVDFDVSLPTGPARRQRHLPAPGFARGHHVRERPARPPRAPAPRRPRPCPAAGHSSEFEIQTAEEDGSDGHSRAHYCRITVATVVDVATVASQGRVRQPSMATTGIRPRITAA